NQYKNLIFPVDFKSENKEKLFWCIYLARYFNSKVILFKYPIADKSLLKKVNTNLNFAVRFLIQNNVQYEIQTAPSGAKFTRETLNFAGSVDADLIIINTTKHINFTDYLLGAEEQQVIANNSRIPVMCVNPRSSFSGVGQFMYGR
ncbi:MAG: universal stress protein, partial [Bacteroidota bacterium]